MNRTKWARQKGWTVGIKATGTGKCWGKASTISEREIMNCYVLNGLLHSGSVQCRQQITCETLSQREAWLEQLSLAEQERSAFETPYTSQHLLSGEGTDYIATAYIREKPDSRHHSWEIPDSSLIVLGNDPLDIWRHSGKIYYVWQLLSAIYGSRNYVCKINPAVYSQTIEVSSQQEVASAC